MVNIILQHFAGELRELDNYSIENISNYAKMVGADYKLIRGKPFRKHLTAPCQKIFLLDKTWDEYDQVLMLDIDMFAPRTMKENVFDYEGIGLYEDVQKKLHGKLVNQYPFNSSSTHPYWGGAIYKMDKDLRVKLRAGLGNNESWMNFYNKLYNFEDEGIMHTLAYRSNVNRKNAVLHKKWCQCSFLPNPENAGFIHIRTKITPQGPKREKIVNYNELVEKGIL